MKRNILFALFFFAITVSQFTSLTYAEDNVVSATKDTEQSENATTVSAEDISEPEIVSEEIMPAQNEEFDPAAY